jgi:glucose-6-phosphate-specific signal transduction histidine kinase
MRDDIPARDNNSLSYVERAIELAQFGLAEARRSAFSLQPTIIEELGLIRALQKLVERSNIPGRLRCNFHSTGVPEESFPASVLEDLLRIAQEAMSNAMRHRRSSALAFGAIRQTSFLRSPITDPASPMLRTRAERASGYPICKPEPQILAQNLRFELPRIAAQALSFACRASEASDADH